jgi:Oxaloacetate decarboxylase, gamma chain.
MNVEVFEGLLIVVVGTIMVILALGILAAVPLMIQKLLKVKPLKPYESTALIQPSQRVITTEIDLKPEELALITAAVIAFNEYKSKILMENPVIKQLPDLIKLLPLTGKFYEAEVKVSIGGKEEVVKVNENVDGSLTVKYRDKTRKIRLQVPIE